MKKTLKMFLTVMVCVLCSVSFLHAQSYPQATSSSDTGISIPLNSPLVDKYEIDYSNLNWTPQIAQQAATYLADQSEHITIEVDEPNSRLILTLDLDNDQTQYWNIQKWSVHLSEIR